MFIALVIVVFTHKIENYVVMLVGNICADILSVCFLLENVQMCALE